MNFSHARIFGRSLILTLLLAVSGVPARAAETSPAKPAAFAVQVTGSGRPMLLIPGLACGGDVWDGTVAHFKDRYQCHVFTMAGFAGQPAIPPPLVESFRQAIIQYIHEAKLERPIVVGHSLGGFLALWLGATAPEECGPIVAVDGVPFFSALRDEKATAAASAPIAEFLRQTVQSQTAEQLAAANRGTLKEMITAPEELERVAAASAKSDPKAVAQGLYELMTTDLRGQMRNIQSPVLLLGATASIADAQQKTKAEQNYRAQVEAIRKHEVIFAPKARHFIQLDEPEFFYQQLEAFLAKSGR